ncbi:MAG: hypothetical protein U0X20_22025 [Caldilineaceae bacterium]
MPKQSHELIVQTPIVDSHYKVAETDKLQGSIAEVTIISSDWLDQGTSVAIYQVGENRKRGSFAVHGCQCSVGQIRFVKF